MSTVSHLRPPWKKGQSGNPSGVNVPKEAQAHLVEARRLCMENAPAAVRKLLQLMDCGKPEVEKAAAVEILDRVGATVVPLSVRYRVECLTTRRTMLDWTDVSPASSVAVTIPASANVLSNQRNSRERFAVTMEANYGTDTAFTNTKAYDVQNMNGIE